MRSPGNSEAGRPFAVVATCLGSRGRLLWGLCVRMLPDIVWMQWCNAAGGLLSWLFVYA